MRLRWSLFFKELGGLSFRGVRSRPWTKTPLLSVLALVLFPGLWGCETGESTPQVVVYTSLDQHYSRPVLEAFEARTGIEVLARYDTEADKTTGLFNRLMEERSRPRADVFWNSEVLRTVLLARAGALEPLPAEVAASIPSSFHASDRSWVGFAARYRVLIYNTEKVPASAAPRSILELAHPRFRGQAALALPLAGTTQTHFGALQASLGDRRMEALIDALIANEVRIVNGNAVVRDLVASGTVMIGLTDTDDASEGQSRGAPLEIVYPDQELPPAIPGLDLDLEAPLGTFLIPNTVCRVKGGPNPGPARELIEYLVSAEVEQDLAGSGSVQIPLTPGIDPPAGIPAPATLVLTRVALESAASGVEALEPRLRERFLR